MKFYTGQGDSGTSIILGSAKRIPKSDRRFEVLGAVDELNSYLGVCRSLAKDKSIKKALLEAQENLFIIQAELGRIWKPGFPGKPGFQPVTPNKITNLEKTIDKFGNKISPITKFSIPGGAQGRPLSAHLDYARAVCRRAERKCLDVGHPSGRPTSQNWPAISYLNRLSSLLFVLARYANKKARICEKNPSYK